MTGISRRAALAAGAAALTCCRRRRGSGYDGFVFVANQQGSNVAVVDLLAFGVAKRIAIDGAPSMVLADSARRVVYVLCPDQGIIYEIDAVRHSVRRAARLGAPATAMQLAHSGDSLWVLCREPHTLCGIPLDSFRPAARIKLPGAAAAFDLSPDGIAAVSFPGERYVGLAELRSSTLGTRLAAPGEPGPVCFRPDSIAGRQVIAGNGAARTVSIWDVKTGRPVVNLPVPMEPARFCFSGDGGQLFISGPGMDAVTIVYPYRTEVAETILAGKSPESMAASGTPPYLYLFVANPQSATVTVLDIETRRLVAVAGVGAEPGQILFTPDNAYVLVLNRGSGDLAVMRMNSLRTAADGKTRRNNPSPLFTMIPVGSRPAGAAVVSA